MYRIFFSLYGPEQYNAFWITSYSMGVYQKLCEKLFFERKYNIAGYNILYWGILRYTSISSIDVEKQNKILVVLFIQCYKFSFLVFQIQTAKISMHGISSNFPFLLMREILFPLAFHSSDFFPVQIEAFFPIHKQTSFSS